MEAFHKARALRADAVELDVRRTADDRLVVHHDASIDGVRVVDATLEEIRGLAPWVPTLSEALDACAGMWVNIEVKNLPVDPDWDPEEGVAREVARVAAALDANTGVLVSSFNPAALIAVHSVDATLATALLTVAVMDPLMALDAAAEAGHIALHPHVDALAGHALDAAAARARELGLGLVPWTVDDPAEIRRLAGAGVAGVITNLPDVARRALERGSADGRDDRQ